MLCSSRHCSQQPQVEIRRVWLGSQLGLGCSLTDDEMCVRSLVKVRLYVCKNFYKIKIIIGVSGVRKVRFKAAKKSDLPSQLHAGP